MKLVIFDVDGTLTDTSDVDGHCFQLSLELEFGFTSISRDWETYQHTTDLGIALEVLRSNLRRQPRRSELRRMQNRFLELLHDAFCNNPGSFLEIPGATNVLGYLKNETDWKIAIATGCWAESALFKLRTAGMIPLFPFASCEDSISRDEIVRIAIEKSKVHYDCKTFDPIVYVGDGVWDFQTANHLGIGFVGVSNSASSSRLADAGAKFICQNFQLTPVFLNYLNLYNGYDNSN